MDFLGSQRLAEYVGQVDRLVDAVEAFVTWHQRGQPGQPDTLYPMTYAVQDQWREEWERRLTDLIGVSLRPEISDQA